MNIEKEITTFEELEKLISSSLIKKLENHLGLFYFAKSRSKFEGWLKTELCEIFAKNNEEANITIEKYVKRKGKKYYKIDLVYNDDFAIELKTINTNYEKKNNPYLKCNIEKNRPLGLNCQHLQKDIEKLKKLNYKHNILVFIVFPLTNPVCDDWTERLKKINSGFDPKPHPFAFRNKIPGILYISQIK